MMVRPMALWQIFSPYTIAAARHQGRLLKQNSIFLAFRVVSV
jgi:hypothetical protein